MEEKNTQKKDKKSKIIPSYEKKSEDNNKNTKKIKSRITIYILIIVAVLIIVSLFLVVYNLVLNNKYKDYVLYENNMNNYGFNKMYDDFTANTTEKVTKSELVKVLVSSLLNTYDISDIWSMTEIGYDNQIWVDYAEQHGFIPQGYINSENQDDRATYIEALTLLSNYKTIVLGKNLDIESSPKFKDFDEYTNEEQTMIRDMVWNKILEDNEESLKAYRKIVKGELNQLITKFVEKYNTITLTSDDKLNINSEKLPYNYELYTYTLANINKKVYEAKFDYTDVSKSILPKDMYIKYKDEISSWIIMIDHYYNTILNVDYNNFDKNEFLENINLFVINNYDLAAIEKYEKYIKDNEIVIDGNVKVQMPIVYFDGQNIRIRTQIQYSILSSKTNENVLFGDLNTLEKVIYDKDAVIAYIDVKLIENLEDISSVYLSNININNLLVSELQ